MLISRGFEGSIICTKDTLESCVRMLEFLNEVTSHLRIEPGRRLHNVDYRKLSVFSDVISLALMCYQYACR